VASSWFSRLLGRPADPPGRRRLPLPATPSAPSSARPATASRTNPFQAVGVVAGARPCAAALGTRGVRFLARQSPRLPLPECDRCDQCRCRFEKFIDRRMHQQRVPFTNLAAVSFAGVEQRGNRGRRGTDR